jgi:hypothetical protein
VVIVALLSVIAWLIDLGLKPLWAEMIQVYDSSVAEVKMPRRDGLHPVYLREGVR